MSIDGRPDDFPASWHPTEREVAEALIAEIRNALVPARHHIEHATSDDHAERMEKLRVQVQRVLDFAYVCSRKLQNVAV